MHFSVGIFEVCEYNTFLAKTWGCATVRSIIHITLRSCVRRWWIEYLDGLCSCFPVVHRGVSVCEKEMFTTVQVNSCLF